jgi:hypothetical protein
MPMPALELGRWQFGGDLLTWLRLPSTHHQRDHSLSTTGCVLDQGKPLVVRDHNARAHSPDSTLPHYMRAFPDWRQLSYQVFDDLTGLSVEKLLREAPASLPLLSALYAPSQAGLVVPPPVERLPEVIAELVRRLKPLTPEHDGLRRRALCEPGFAMAEACLLLTPSAPVPAAPSFVPTAPSLAQSRITGWARWA